MEHAHSDKSTTTSANIVDSASDPPAETSEALANTSAEDAKGNAGATSGTIGGVTPANEPADSSAEDIRATAAVKAGSIWLDGIFKEVARQVETKYGPIPAETATDTSTEDDSSHLEAFVEDAIKAFAQFEGYYRLVRLSAIRKWTRWKRYQDLDPDEYVGYYPKRWSEPADSGSTADKNDDRKGSHTFEGEFEDPETHTNAKGSDKGGNTTGRKNKRKRRLYFISHRWLDPVYPDIEGSQLSRVQRLSPAPLVAVDTSHSSSNIDPALPPDSEHDDSSTPIPSTSEEDDVLIFYDYSSLPQSPRTPMEKVIFDAGIVGLNSLLARMRVIVLADANYKSRAWCLMEYFIAAFHGCLVYDDVRDEAMEEVQQRNMAPNRERIKTSAAEVEALRMKKIGELAQSFFAGPFGCSSVTNTTDRKKIEMVFREFLQLNLCAWTHEPYIGWRPQTLSKGDIDGILQGQPVPLMLGAGGGVGLQAPAMPGPESGLRDMGIPHSFLAGGSISPADQADDADVLDGYWQRALALRGVKALMRYYRLNDPSGHRDYSLIKAILEAEGGAENDQNSPRADDDDGLGDDDEPSSSAIGEYERGDGAGRPPNTAGELGWKMTTFITAVSFIVWIWFAALLVGRAIHRTWLAARRGARAATQSRL